MNRHPLLDNLVDYAGLFPPAQLPFPEAVREYHQHRGEADSWMLGQFICPVGRLDEFLPFGSLFPPESPLTLSLLPAPGDSLTGRVASTLENYQAFAERFEGVVALRILEARMPPASPSVEDLFSAAHRAHGTALYVEWSPDHPDLETHLRLVAEARRQAAANLGAKIRCGGTEPEAFPSVASVAAFIAACASLAIPFKATAGLHHPVRHDRDGFTMHGFLNVFGAAVLAINGRNETSLLEKIVGERDPEAFSLAGGGFSWRGETATPEQVQAAREIAHAYGSCSFAEPREDLTDQNWFGFANEITS